MIRVCGYIRWLRCIIFFFINKLCVYFFYKFKVSFFWVFSFAWGIGCKGKFEFVLKGVVVYGRRGVIGISYGRIMF